MMHHIAYIPVLKAKRGELDALEDLGVASKRSVLPLLEVASIPYDFEDEQPTKRIDEHLATLPAKIKNAWGVEQAILVDGFLVEEENLEDGTNSIAWLFNGLRQEGVRAIPVIGFDRYPQYEEAVKNIVATDQRGCCLRIQTAQLEDVDELQEKIDALLVSVGVAPKDVDLVIDFGPMDSSQMGVLRSTLSLTINSFPRLLDWRMFSISSGAFPMNLTEVYQQSTAKQERADWLLWVYLWERRKKLKRVPVFSDYAVAFPEPEDIDPRLMRMSPNIRYTQDKYWLIVKGKALSKKKDKVQNPPARIQYPELSTSLIGSDYFQGENCCKGDAFIVQCAAKTSGPGNATTWRRVGTCHHLTFVVKQIAGLPVV